MKFGPRHFSITRQRFEVVYGEISDGSEPGPRFYILVAVSTLIACFGLIANSTAVVIGAMLVAPLMTPIFGMSLALVRGETHLFGRAVQAEVVGVATSVAMGVMLGLVLGYFEPTPEMLSRTKPNLMDLLVAILAGFAGAYALVDVKISPALPGVAISTAIVPPLANTGLCLSLGEVSGGMGSFLLFLANFLSILLVSSATFIVSGMAKIYGEQPSRREYLRRFGIAIVSFVIIAGFLTGALFSSIKERHINNLIHAALKKELAKMPSAGLDEVHHYTDKQKLYVLADVHSPATITPSRIKIMQEKISQDVDMATRLTVRSVRSANVTAQGSAVYDSAFELDGKFGRPVKSLVLRNIAIAEQILREKFEDQHAVYFYRAEFMQVLHRNIIKAYVGGLHLLNEDEILQLEAAIRQATGDESLELIIRTAPEKLQSSVGMIRYGWILGDKATPERLAIIKEIKAELYTAFQNQGGFEIVNVNANYLDSKFHFLIEVVGPEIYPQEKLDAIRRQLAEKFTEAIDLYVWSRPEVVLTPNGAMPLDAVYHYFAKRQKENLPDEMMLFLETSTD
ncbi:MAG: TIGR00341 family protein [Desulfobacterales bacterium]